MCPCKAFSAVAGGASPQNASMSSSAGDYLAPMQEQQHEQRPLLGAGRRELAARVEHAQWAQEPELQYVPAGG